jgi:glycosyltransferase 2 family protein
MPDRVGSTTEATARRPGFFERHAGKFALSLLITLALWYALHQGGLKLVPESGDFKQVRWWVLPVYFVILFAMTWFRSVRWRFLLRSIADVPKKRLFAVSCIGFAAIVILPFRIGEIVRPLLIRTPARDRTPGSAGRPISLAAATSSVVAERIIDGLYLSVVLALALWLVEPVHPLPDRVVGLRISVSDVRWSGFSMLGLFSLAFATIAVFYFARSWAHGATLAVVGKVSTKLAEKLARIFENFADGLHVLGHAGDAFGFFVETSIYWGLNVLGVWLVAWGCGVAHLNGTPPTFGEACALVGMLGCTILIPGPPGMVGVFQAGLYAAMTMYYPTNVVTGPGAAFVFLLYASQVLVTFVAGGLGLLVEGRAIEVLEQA